MQKIDLLRVYTISRLFCLVDHTDTRAGILESINLSIRSKVKKWLHLPSTTCDSLLYSSMRHRGLGLARLAGLNPSIQARRLHRLAQSSGEVIREALTEDDVEAKYTKLWIRAGGDEEEIPSLWTTRSTAVLEVPMKEELTKWERPTPKFKYPNPCNWRNKEFLKWKQMVSQGHGIEQFEDDTTSNACFIHYRGIPHRKLLTVLQL
ncbi:hypothetical protein DUI87_20737 [Hirundo rustica rustica]|uniref:Uncharacterized protein n=1 Tax=Hirundo rustica rustica TaxID=333673 RepID=A0A3M0K8S5_HIRRU|nr:hypothetical protein DUI87_20737 [Hirundo rustica rustica]